MPTIKEILESLHSTITGHVRDFSLHKRDIWLYGVLVGWDLRYQDLVDSIGPNVYISPEDFERMQSYNRVVTDIKRGKLSTPVDMGRRGGKSKSPKKLAAAKENGKKGGPPGRYYGRELSSYYSFPNKKRRDTWVALHSSARVKVPAIDKDLRAAIRSGNIGHFEA